jgi:hypothetical protein
MHRVAPGFCGALGCTDKADGLRIFAACSLDITKPSRWRAFWTAEAEPQLIDLPHQ